MTLICPICHSRFGVEVAIQSEAGRAYVSRLMNLPDQLRFAVGRYLLMFASAKRELSYDRRLKMVEEVLAIEVDRQSLAVALAETVEALMQKREAGDVRPLKNHRYLLSVLQTTVTTAGNALQVPTGQPIRRGRKSAGLVAQDVLQQWADNDWLRIEICNGLLALLALPLYKSPEAETIDRTASLWEMELRKGKIILVEEIDRMRVQKGFATLLSRVKERFPEPSMLSDLMPRRPPQRTLTDEVEVSEEDREAGRQILRNFTEGR